MERQYPDRPFVAVGGVIWREDQFLLVLQDRPKLGAIWTLPGGVQEVGETVEGALIREIREETRLEVKIGPLIDVVDGIFHDPEGRVLYHYTLVDYRCQWIAGEAKAASDVKDVAWRTLADLCDIRTWGETRRIVEMSANLASPQRPSLEPE